MAETVEITRYPNRRLYDRSQKKYVTLGEIEALVLRGQNVRVRDSKTDEDLTRVILVQILLERHPERMKMFPVVFLQEILRADQMALDWLTVYFGQAKAFMEGVANSASASFMPSVNFWQSFMTGSKKTPEALAAENSIPHAEENRERPQSEIAMAKRLAELERRLNQLEDGQKNS